MKNHNHIAKGEVSDLTQFLISKAERVIENFESVDIKQAKDVSFLCLNNNNSYAKALGIEVLGLIHDTETCELLLEIDIEKASYVETICLIEALTRYPTKKQCEKVLNIINNSNSTREICLLSCDSLYRCHDLVGERKLKEQFLQENDQHVKIALAGIIFLKTNEIYFLTFMKNCEISKNASVRITATDYINSVLN